MSTVTMENGASRRMLHCRRRDCDNWQTETTAAQPVRLYDDS